MTPDISIMLRFHFYEPVYYRVQEPTFPSQSREASGKFIGFSETVGHAMTFKVLLDETSKILHRSEVRSASKPGQPNLRLATETKPSHVRTNDTANKDDDSGRPSTPEMNGETTSDTHTSQTMSYLPPADLVGRRFNYKHPESNVLQRATVVSAINDHHQAVGGDEARTQYLLSINDDAYEDVMSYNDILSHVENTEDRLWKFQSIVSHQGPLPTNHPEYNGSPWNLTVAWENGEQTTEPLLILAVGDDPVSVAIYAGDNDLLETNGWRCFKAIYIRHKAIVRRVALARLRGTRITPKYMYGIEIPRNYEHAMRLDRENGNDRWHDCTQLEMQQLTEYTTFEDLGKDVRPDEAYKKIRMMADIKHGWLPADISLTSPLTVCTPELSLSEAFASSSS